MPNPLERPQKPNNNNNNQMPNPWLFEKTPPLDNSAGFTEYLRWMREPDSQYKDGTKIEILQTAQDNSQNYRKRLEKLNQRTKLMAGEDNTFEAKSTWRLRVGGHRGPENILLPAFDALGMPYLPSSSLRGVARNYAIREFMKNQSLSWQEAEKQIAPYFGSLETDNKAHQAGQIVFFDAYPQEGCLEIDMANNIWNWEGNKLKYSPNPNPFLSLKDATFVIGLKLASNCQDKKILDSVKNWLIKGLQEGIGSQINSGYGQLKEVPLSKGDLGGSNSEFLTMNFTLKGQLIHGSQQLYDLDEPYRKNRDGSFKLSQGKYQFNTYADDEVRVTAFKSMLRYWFRAFALGVLTINEVQEWEGKLFGLIQPTQHKNTAWVKFNLINGKTIELEDECNKQKGTLILSYSPFIPEDYKNIIVDLFNNLIWLTFRLGAVGQGARRPYYERNSNPWYRGTNIYLKNPDDDKFWSITSNGEQLCIRFRNKIKRFYKVLERLTNNTDLINNISNQFAQVTNHQWSEVVDTNCQILLIPKHKNIGKKTPALKLLHQDFHHLENQWNDLKKEVKELKNKNKYRESKEKQKQANEIYAQMKSLCGGVNTEKDFFGKGKDRGATPSPIWIKDLDIFEVVTVFGATQNPRKEFLKKLQDNADSYYQIFPL